MAVNLNKLATLGQMHELASRVVTAIEPLSASFKSAEVVDNTIKFYASKDKSGDPVFSFDLGEEKLLDQTNTTFVDDFKFSTETYKGATDPKLEGKPVLVMGLKAGDGDEIKYSFVNMEKLIKTYESTDKSISVDGFDLSVNISEEKDNVLSLKTDGLYVKKTDATVEGATENNIAVFNDKGSFKDSGLSIATDEEVKEMLSSVGLVAADKD